MGFVSPRRVRRGVGGVGETYDSVNSHHHEPIHQTCEEDRWGSEERNGDYRLGGERGGFFDEDKDEEEYYREGDAAGDEGVRPGDEVAAGVECEEEQG